MRIAFDTAPLVRPYPPGVARACRGLVESLEARGRLEVVRLAPEEGEGERAWRHRHLPRLLEQARCLGLHSPVSAFPWRGPGRRVQTVHELPWLHGATENAGLAHRCWAFCGPYRADAVLCPTEHVARDLRRFSPQHAGKVRACPWGVDARFAAEPPEGESDEAVLTELGLAAGGFALCPGAVRGKKNLAAVLRGLARLREREGPRLELVVTGGETPALRRDLALAARLGLAELVHAPGELPEAELAALLRAAAVVPVLSSSEGFCLPVLEACASGTPVLVPEGSAQQEVAGGAGIAVRADEADSVAAGLRRATAERAERRPLALARAAELSWERCAEQVEALWLGWAPSARREARADRGKHLG